MRRTTISRSLVLAVALAAAFVVGCSGRYRHERVDSDDAHAAEVGEMIESLRSVGEADLAPVVRASAVPDLDDRQTAHLLGALEQVAAAERAELERLDRFGKDVYRATIVLSDGGAEWRVSMLLAPVGGELRWARPN